MQLEHLLTQLHERGLRITCPCGRPVVRGAAARVDDTLRAALAEHRRHLVRLHQVPERARARWRTDLAAADPNHRAAWAQLADGYERTGLPAPCADWLAWDDLHTQEPPT